LDTSSKFAQFSNTLLEWNRVHNLTGAKTPQEIYKNIEDSIYPTKFIAKPDSILDIGSGAGFPAIPLAIIYSDIRVVLCEPRNKRASFLKFVSIELGLNNVEVVKRRVENYFDPEPFHLITSRAVTDTKMLLKLTAHLRGEATKYLFYKGENIFNELQNIKSMEYKIVTKDRRNYLYI
jgi:16S rRNA (guanine527-N7)-methyltransferase